jgi:hypothetical protein
MNEPGVSCKDEAPPLDVPARRRLWRFYVGSLVAILLMGAGLITGLTMGWRSPTPRRAPDWTEADLNWRQEETGTQERTRMGYQIAAGTAGQPTQILASRPVRDFIAEIELAPLTSGEESEYGLLFRYRDPADYYLFAVGGDGYYTIVAARAGERGVLKEWQQWPHVHRGAAANRLRVHCEERSCRFYINDEFTAELTQVDPVTGDLGVWSRSFAARPQGLLLQRMRVWSLDTSME